MGPGMGAVSAPPPRQAPPFDPKLAAAGMMKRGAPPLGGQQLQALPVTRMPPASGRLQQGMGAGPLQSLYRFMKPDTEARERLVARGEDALGVIDETLESDIAKADTDLEEMLAGRTPPYKNLTENVVELAQGRMTWDEFKKRTPWMDFGTDTAMARNLMKVQFGKMTWDEFFEETPLIDWDSKNMRALKKELGSASFSPISLDPKVRAEEAARKAEADARPNPFMPVPLQRESTWPEFAATIGADDPPEVVGKKVAGFIEKQSPWKVSSHYRKGKGSHHGTGYGIDFSSKTGADGKEDASDKARTRNIAAQARWVRENIPRDQIVEFIVHRFEDKNGKVVDWTYDWDKGEFVPMAGSAMRYGADGKTKVTAPHLHIALKPVTR